MPVTNTFTKNQKKYRDNIYRKLNAYLRYMQIAVIAQGLLQYLAITQPAAVWSSFGSWLRTIRPGVPPSESVVRSALNNSLPAFLDSTILGAPLLKFILERIDLSRHQGLRLAG